MGTRAKIFYVDEKLHARVKVISAKIGRPMTDIVHNIVEKSVVSLEKELDARENATQNVGSTEEMQ